MKDKVGQQITVGSIILYAAYDDKNCAAMRIGKVMAVREHSAYLKPAITVIGVVGTYPFLEICKRKGTLTSPSKVFVLSPDQLPPIYTRLLSKL